MEWMGKVFASYLGPLLEWIRAEGIGPAIALVIMFIGLLIFCYIAYFSFKDWRLIKKARQVLEQGASESEFANNYNLINQDLLGLPKIKFAWKEFSETLILPAKGDDGVSPC
jgi:hypothetical protein